jgi:hypothetical protein
VVIGLAVLTKGPVAFLIAVLCIATFWGTHKFRTPLKLSDCLLFTLSAMTVSLLFYGIETLLHGTWFIEEFIKYHLRLLTTGDAGHGRPLYFHPLVLLFGCFPASFFALRSFVATFDSTDEQKNFKKWMVILFWVVLILFSLVKTKTVLYSSLTYFPLTFLAAYHLYGLITGALRWNKILTVAIAAFGGLVAAAILLFPIIMVHKEIFFPLIDDAFARACLRNPVPWSTVESVIGACYGGAIALCVFFFMRQRFHTAIVVLFLASALVLDIFLFQFAPKIERYAQGGPIAFYKSLRNKECYIRALFKTYADLFYWRKPPGLDPRSYDRQWLLSGDIDKPAYFVARNIHAHRYIQRYELEILKEGYGFVYFKREPRRGN